MAFSARDDKRYLLPGQTDTIPWGHYKVGELSSNKVVVEESLEPQPTPHEQQLQSPELLSQQQFSSNDQSLKQQAVKRVAISLDYLHSKKFKT